MRLPYRPNQHGFSLLELLLVVVFIGILAAIAVPNLIAASRVAREGRAIANIKTLGNTQTLFYGSANRYAIPDELFKKDYLGNGTFMRNVNSSGMGATEILSDGYYDYSFRYTANADSYTLDADPKMNIRNAFRFFRFRASRTASGGISGSTDIILVAPPQPSLGSPATSAYKPFNPN